MTEQYTQEEQNAASTLLTMDKQQDCVLVPQKTLDAIMEKLTSLEQAVQALSKKQRSYSSGSEAVDNIVEFKVYKKSVLVTGNTKPYKEFLKKYKASWNPSLKGWILNKEKGRRCAKKFRKKYIDIAEVQGQVLADSDSEYSSDSD